MGLWWLIGTTAGKGHAASSSLLLLARQAWYNPAFILLTDVLVPAPAEAPGRSEGGAR